MTGRGVDPSPDRFRFREVGRRLAATALALALTAGMFLVLPLSEMLHPPPPPRLKLLQIDTSRWTPPKPAPRPPRRPLRPAKPRPRPKRRRLVFREPRALRLRPHALHLPARLALSLPNVPGDMALDFGVRPTPPAPMAPPPPQRRQKTVYTRDEADSAPKPVVQPPPLYPYNARLRRIEGFVELEFVVLPNGRTAKIEVLQQQPPGVFADAARAAVRRWRFEPGRKDGKPVSVRMRVRLRFELRK